MVAAPAPAYLTDTELTEGVATWNFKGVDFSVYTAPQRANLIQQASIKIDNFVGQSFMLTNILEDHRGRGGNTLYVRRTPIWTGLSTTLTAPANPGDTHLALADVSGLLPGVTLGGSPWTPQGQAVYIADPLTSHAEPAHNIAAAYTAGTLTVPIRDAILKSHIVGTPVQVFGVDNIFLVQPGQIFPVPISDIMIESALGKIENSTALQFQMYGSTSIFPRGIPLRVQYTFGYPPGEYPWALKQICFELCISTVQRNSSASQGGVQSATSGPVSTTWFNASQVSELSCDQQNALLRLSRGRGMS